MIALKASAKTMNLKLDGPEMLAGDVSAKFQLAELVGDKEIEREKVPQ